MNVRCVPLASIPRTPHHKLNIKRPPFLGTALHFWPGCRPILYFQISGTCVGTCIICGHNAHLWTGTFLYGSILTGPNLLSRHTGHIFPALSSIKPCDRSTFNNCVSDIVEISSYVYDQLVRKSRSRSL